MSHPSFLETLIADRIRGTPDLYDTKKEPRNIALWPESKGLAKKFFSTHLPQTPVRIVKLCNLTKRGHHIQHAAILPCDPGKISSTDIWHVAWSLSQKLTDDGILAAILPPPDTHNDNVRKLCSHADISSIKIHVLPQKDRRYVTSDSVLLVTSGSRMRASSPLEDRVPTTQLSLF